MARSDCRVNSANCKCAHGERLPGPRVVIGDGRSDFCMSTRADFVIAKGALADYCRSRGQPHATFTDFDDVTAQLAAWLATARPRAGQGAAGCSRIRRNCPPWKPRAARTAARNSECAWWIKAFDLRGGASASC